MAMVAFLVAWWWPWTARARQEQALVGLFWVGPVVSGVLAAFVHLRNHPARRPNLWKCSVWIWTWALLFLVVGSIALDAELGGFVLLIFPYTFPAHGLFVLLALIGLAIGEFVMSMHHGWRQRWTQAEWRRNSLLLLLLLLALLLRQCWGL
ncbi:hypothetical protein GCM10028822_04960 [Hymenobacter terrigena]